MPVANVTIHSSQFPDAVRRDLLESLRTRRVNHKFHYDSIKQTQKWLALHQAYAPSRVDPDCSQTYTKAFAKAAFQVRAEKVHLIGLGCGGGRKDAVLLFHLKSRENRLSYTPCDVSTAMVLVARQSVKTLLADDDCHPLVCDLLNADDLSTVLDQHAPADATRLITFFGMIPNFEPQEILPRLAALVRPGDHLFFGANLAPGDDYLAGIQRILPLYDNALTRDWLLAFLFDLGVETGDGELHFSIEDDPAGSGLKRVAARFFFKRAREVKVDSETFAFAAGESVRLFFSYRHMPAQIRAMLATHGLEVVDEWITKSREEGVFLCRRAKV
jgi:uncharacterized SAM-dependent methyltransferase